MKKVYYGFMVANGVDPAKLMEARKDLRFQCWLLRVGLLILKED